MNSTTYTVWADSIVKALGLAVILIASVIAFVVLISRILPRLLLRPKFHAEDITDRGLKKYVFEGGRAIVCRPSEESAKYIKQYLLSSNDGEKYISCKTADFVRTIEYDVAVFDASDHMTDIITVRDRIGKTQISGGVMLPYNTAYAQVIIRAVNSKKIKSDVKAQYPIVTTAAFALATMICTVLEAKLIGYSISSAVGMIMSSDIKNPIGIFIPAAIGLVLACIIFLMHLTKETELGGAEEIQKIKMFIGRLRK